MYYLIESIPTLSSIERAHLISEQLYELSRPRGVRKKEDITISVFQVLDNGTDAVLVTDGDFEIVVHHKADVRILQILYPNITPQERAQLIQYIKGNERFPFKNILPSNANEVDYQYLVDNGFVEE